jgi:hypothetical protein
MRPYSLLITVAGDAALLGVASSSLPPHAATKTSSEQRSGRRSGVGRRPRWGNTL